MPDFSMPAWLTQQHSFADSLLKGVQAGSMIANTRYRNQALAAQAIDAERNYALREKALAVDQEQKDIMIKSRLLEMEANKQMLADQVSDKEALAGWISERNRLSPEKRLGMPIPNLKLPASFNAANQIYDNDRMAYEKTIDGQLQSQFAVRIGKLPPSYQRRYKLAGSPEEQDRILEEGEAAALKKTFSPGPLEKDLSYYQGLLDDPNSDPSIRDLAKSILQSKAQKSGFSVKFGTGGTVESVDYGPQAKTDAGAAPTIGFKTKLQEQLANDAGTVELLSVMQNNMTDADFGVRGMARDLKVRLGGQLGVDVEDEDLSVRKTIPLLRAALQKALKTDSNITEAERQDIKRALPSEGWLESRKNAEESINVLVPWLRNRARRSATELGVEPPVWAMTADEIKSAYSAGKLSEAEALKVIQQFRIPIPNAR